jgi:hypothetical protein
MNFGASLRELAQLARYAHKAKFCIFSLKYGRPGKACLIIFAPSAMLAWYTQHVRILTSEAMQATYSLHGIFGARGNACDKRCMAVFTPKQHSWRSSAVWSYWRMDENETN